MKSFRDMTQISVHTSGIPFASSGCRTTYSRRASVFARTACTSVETRCNLTSASSWAPECLLLGVPIEPEDVDLLCVHFQPTSEHNDGAHGLTSAICRKDA